jgi:hypothetical protein
MRIASSGSLVVALLSASLVTSSAQAVVYEVNRSFTEGSLLATLTGTVSVTLGNYVIQNAAPNPFTDVNLTMHVDGVSYSLTNALTGLISGSGQFVVDATAMSLEFAASGDELNPADLVFSDSTELFSPIRYGIGSDSDAAFEAAYGGPSYVVAAVQFPVVFGVAIPEPSTGLMLLIGMAAVGTLRRTRVS